MTYVEMMTEAKKKAKMNYINHNLPVGTFEYEGIKCICVLNGKAPEFTWEINRKESNIKEVKKELDKITDYKAAKNAGYDAAVEGMDKEGAVKAYHSSIGADLFLQAFTEGYEEGKKKIN